MERRYLWAIVIVITLLSMLIAYPRESVARSERSTCSDTHGSLQIEWIEQEGSNWCWVATLSEVLKWYGLPNVDQCHLYDLAKEDKQTTSCRDLIDFPADVWTKDDGINNQTGFPAKAAEAYEKHHPGSITFNIREQPLQPFQKLADDICPADGTEGQPFIWAYNTGNGKGHDVVVYGYNDLGDGEQILYIHDPDHMEEAFEANTVDYEEHYANEDDFFIRDVVISKK